MYFSSAIHGRIPVRSPPFTRAYMSSNVLEMYRDRLLFIEQEFGRPFLDRTAYSKLSPDETLTHVIRYNWRVASSFLRGIAPNQTDLSNPSLAIIAYLADLISEAKKKENYNENIKKDIKDIKKVNSLIHEMLCAQICSRLGAVEFVLREDKDERRTPDLKVSRGDGIVYLECQRNMRLSQRHFDRTTNKNIWKFSKSLLHTLPSKTDIVIFTFSESEQEILSIINDAWNMSRAGRTGSFHDRRHAGTWISIFNNLESHGIEIDGNEISGNIHVGSDMGAHWVLVNTEEGVTKLIDAKRIQIFTLNFQSMKSIRGAFDRKRQKKQIPTGSAGILCFDVDVQHLRRRTAGLCMELVLNELARQAWAGGQNTSIAGLMLTAWPYLTATRQDEWTFLQCTEMHQLKPREEHSLPDWFQLETLTD